MIYIFWGAPRERSSRGTRSVAKRSDEIYSLILSNFVVNHRTVCFVVVVSDDRFSPNWHYDPLCNSSDQCLKVDIFVPSFRELVGCENNALGDEVDLTSFCFDQEGVTVTEAEEEVVG